MSDHSDRLRHAIRWMDIKSIQIQRSGEEGDEIVVIFGPNLWSSIKASELRDLLAEKEERR